MIQQLWVHAGIFHADDVFCGAIARILNPDCSITRVNRMEQDITDLRTGIVAADIGGGLFDHHQPDCPFRPDGVRHCAASRMWAHWGVDAICTLCPDLTQTQAQTVADQVDRALLHTIAAVDNGDFDTVPAGILTVSGCIQRFVPTWNSDENMENAYQEALAFANGVLRREIMRAASGVRAETLVKDALRKMENGILVLDKFMPWQLRERW